MVDISMTTTDVVLKDDDQIINSIIKMGSRCLNKNLEGVFNISRYSKDGCKRLANIEEKSFLNWSAWRDKKRWHHGNT